MPKKPTIFFCLLTLTLTLSTYSHAELMSVAISGAEVRSAPSAMASKVLFQTGKHTPLSVLDRGVEYHQVADYRGRKGYIHKSLLSSEAAVVVTSERANVRSGPGTGHPVVLQLSQGEAARLLGRSEGWVEVETTAGKQGWLADFLVWGD